VILKSGKRTERREKTKRWSPNEMDTKSFKFQVLFILRPINKKPDLQKKDRGFFNITLHRLPPKTHREVHSGRFSGLRIVLIPAPSHPVSNTGQWLLAGFVPDYSGVAVPDSHGVPF